jgi:tetraacyldisaccharide 4'-kinase
MRTLSQIFAAGVAVRNGLYDRGMLKVRRLTRPVVSIGNLSAGGSGKTPFVIALGDLLKRRSVAFDVLSRGYGRRSGATLIVDPQGSAEQFGDEPLLIARKLQVPVIVGGDRYEAGMLAEKTFQSKLHLLDDGFQHRRLHRDVDIVMLTTADLEDALLPLGRLREPLSSLQRADAVVMTGDGVAESEVRRWMGAPEQVWRAQRVLDVSSSAGKVLAFCGIARPVQFFEQLRSQPIDVVSTIAFSDHHRYSGREIARLLEEKAAKGADSFVTTEKDAINLGAWAQRLGTLHVARLRLALDDGQTVIETLVGTLEQRCNCEF